MIEVRITENEAQQRLDRFLRKYLKTLSLGEIYKLFRTNKVKVNLKKVKENYMLAVDDEVQLFIENQEASDIKVKSHNASSKPVDIVYEDENLLICNKPIGLLTHPDKPEDTDTLIGRALYYLTQKPDYSNTSHTFAPSVCNRLDRNTGGIVVVAKNYKTLKAVNELIRERKLKKLYTCIVKGQLKESGEIKNFLVKDEKNNKVTIIDAKASDAKSNDAKAVHTIYRTLKKTSEYTMLEVELITGRSHQIRAHFASIGHPLIGDLKYGDPQVNEYFKRHFGMAHQFLYAYRIEFEQVNEELEYLKGKSFTCDIPIYMQRVSEKLFDEEVKA